MIAIKGYEKLKWDKETFDSFYKYVNDYSSIPSFQLGCVATKGLGLLNYPQDSFECLNDYCGKCWKRALSEDYD
jgi:hypothetical protein